MMKHIFLAVLLLSIILTVNAQSINLRVAKGPKALTMGVRFGVNQSSMVYSEHQFMDNTLSFAARTGMVGALFIDYRLPNLPMAVVLETLYSEQGANVDLWLNNNDNGTARIKNSYLNVPIMLATKNYSAFRVRFGIQASFILSSKVEHTLSNVSKTINTKDMHKGVFFSVPVGVSVTTKSGIEIDGRYNIPLTNIIYH